MNVLKVAARLVAVSRQATFRAATWQSLPIQFLRNSSSSSGTLAKTKTNSTTENSPQSLTLKIFRPDKEEITDLDLDEWLKAARTLREGKKAPETETEIYLQEFLKPEQFLQEEFQPSEAQLAEVEKFRDAPVPLKNDPTIEHFVNVIMRHGKKSKARTIVSRAFYIVYLRLRKDPVKVFYEALEKLGPLFDTRTEKTGFAKNRVVPYPLNKRQRNRYAMNWILDGSNNKKSPALSVRLAEEIINAYEGRSSGYEKRARMHKEATAQRSYIRT